jgi:O-antigen/teichoic acid export membrane protein
MSLKRRIARNVVWNWAGTATHMLAGFIVFPVLIRRLGVDDCGLWLLIVSLTGYFDLLDLGLRGSLGRSIAFYRAKEEAAGVNIIFNTGMALLGGGAVLVLLATAGVQLIFFDLFAVRPEAQPDVRLAVWLIGINLALIFPFNAFEAVLWGHERFDLLNRVDIPCVILRSALTIWLVGHGPENLVTLAVIIVAITILRGAGLAFCAFRVQHGLRFSARLVRFRATRELFDFGIWCFLMSIANVITQQLGPTLIGNRFGTGAVTPFSAASRLVNYVKIILNTSCGVLTPLATVWHASAEHDKQRWLFVGGAKFCLALGLFFVGGFWFLGGPFLQLWTGYELEFAWATLMILILGELLPLSQAVTYSTVLGMNRHRLWAVMSLLEVGLILGLAAVFLSMHVSMLSIALAIALPGALCRGLIQMIYVCRLLGVPLLHYVRVALLPPLLVAVVPVALLGLLVAWHVPDSWAVLFGFGVLYAGVYGLAVGLLLVRPDRLKNLVRAFRERSRPAAAAEAPPTEVPSPVPDAGEAVLQ